METQDAGTHETVNSISIVSHLFGHLFHQAKEKFIAITVGIDLLKQMK